MYTMTVGRVDDYYRAIVTRFRNGDVNYISSIMYNLTLDEEIIYLTASEDYVDYRMKIDNDKIILTDITFKKNITLERLPGAE